MARVFVGGLLAGATIFALDILYEVLLGDRMRAALQESGLPSEPTSTQVVLYLGLDLALGNLAVWL